MFKEQDNMRPGPTPERVLAICRIVAGGEISSFEIFKLSELDENTTSSEESIRRSIDAAEELGLIKKKTDKYLLNIKEEDLVSAEAFRKCVVTKAFENSKTTFFQLTEWFINNEEQALKLNRFDDYAAIAAKTGVETITENDVLGWRFWMRFLGHAYQYNKTLIPNMKVRLEDALESVKPNTQMTCTKFISWIKENIPEAASACSKEQLPLALSNGLRTLHNEGKVELIRTRDAVKIKLYPLSGVQQELNEFSDIIIKEV